MTPRLTQLKDWTALPQEFCEKAVLVFAQNFLEEAERGQFVVDGRIYPNEIIVRAGFLEAGRLRQTNFEVSIDHSADKNAMAQLFLGIDVLGSVFETHFEHLHNDEQADVDYPMHWEEFEFDDSKVFLRFSTANTALEQEADRLLGLGSGGLYQEVTAHLTESPDDALLRAEIDSELAKEVSKALRTGEFRPSGHEAVDDPDFGSENLH